MLTVAPEVQQLVDQMKEKRPLPMTMDAMDAWADNLINGACIPKDPSMDEELHRDSLKFALYTMIINIGPTEDHECDGFFIKKLRKGAINQLAEGRMRELRDRAKARLAEQEAKTKGEVTATEIVGETLSGEQKP